MRASFNLYLIQCIAKVFVPECLRFTGNALFVYIRILVS